MQRLLRFVIVTAAVSALQASSLLAQAGNPFTVEDLLTAVRVSDPQLSPDGRMVLFTRTTTTMPSGRRNADIWMVPADGSAPPHPFIESPKTDNSARFLPDGKHVVFISNREGDFRVYLADIDGKILRAITPALPGGVQPPLIVSPDGKKIAYVSDVRFACPPADPACPERISVAPDTGPVRVHVLTRLPFRHWDEWWDDVRHHVFVTDFTQTGATRDVSPGDFDAPPHNYEDGAIAFSPESREVAFVSKHNGDAEMWTTNHDVWTAQLDRNELAARLTHNPAADMQPTYTPDGKSIVVRAQRRVGFESDRWYLDVYDRATGSKRTVFESPDLSVDDYRLSPDGKTIWFQAEEKAAANVYVVPFAGGVPRRVVQGGAFGEIRAGAGFAIVSKSTLNAPAELFRIAEDGTAKQLTSENPWLRAVAFEPPATANVTGAAGASVQYWIVKPPHFDATRRYPVVFMIHGGPQGDWHDGWSYRWNPSLWAAQGWIVVAPNPRGSTGFGQKFVDEISQDWCGKVMTDLNAVVNAVAKAPYADSAHMAVVGASYGGYAVDWIIAHTRRFKAAVSHDGVFNLESMSLATDELWFSDWEAGGSPWTSAARRNYARCSPHLFADRIRTPTLVITNLQDFRVPVDQGLQLFTSLRRNGVPSEGLVFENEGHFVLDPLDSKRWHEAVFAWLRKYLGP